jgi:hypothetical protein
MRKTCLVRTTDSLEWSSQAAWSEPGSDELPYSSESADDQSEPVGLVTVGD